MTTLTLEQWRERLNGYIAAEQRILKSQEYTVGGSSTGRRNRLADLESVQAGIRECYAEIAKLETTSNHRARRTFQLRPF